MKNENIDLIDLISRKTPLQKKGAFWLGRCPICSNGQIKVTVNDFTCSVCSPNPKTAEQYQEIMENRSL